MIPAEIVERDGFKTMIISGEYLDAKHAKIRGGRQGYLKWLTALLRKNGFWRPESINGQRLHKLENQNAYMVRQRT